MPKLVAPDGIMYVVNDTGPDQADLAERRADLPPKKNLNQLLRWCVPGGRDIADVVVIGQSQEGRE